jgi:glycosyltransferase involved in cell wall biosynthesis
MGQHSRVPAEFAAGDRTPTSTQPVSTAFHHEQSSHSRLNMGDPISLLDRPGNSSYPKPLSLSILMAVYNEEKTITRVIDEILQAKFPCDIELIVVNDGSTDRTPTLLSRVDDPRVTVLHHLANEGKGAAIMAAAALATGTYILPFDADLEYEPEDIPRMLEPVLKRRCEVVYGARLSGYNTVYQSYIYAAGNRLLTRMANILFNAHLTDLHTCLKLVPLVMLRSLNLHEKGFGLDSEITAGLLRQGIRPFEVPVSYYGRSHAEGKKIKWRDALACVRILLRVRVHKIACREAVGNRRGQADTRTSHSPAAVELQEARSLDGANGRSERGRRFI